MTLICKLTFSFGSVSSPCWVVLEEAGSEARQAGVGGRAVGILIGSGKTETKNSSSDQGAERKG